MTTDLKKEIEKLSKQFEDMLTIDEPKLDDYPEEEWKEVYGDDLFYTDIMQELIKKKAILTQRQNDILPYPKG